MRYIIAMIATSWLLFSTSVFAGNWGDMVWGQDLWGASSSITIKGVKRLYTVSDVIDVTVEQTCSDNHKNVDLWMAIEMPNRLLWFKTKTAFLNFSDRPQPAVESIDKKSYSFINMEVPAGIGGDYTFYAACVKSGKNPIADGFSVMLEMDVKETTLANE